MFFRTPDLSEPSRSRELQELALSCLDRQKGGTLRMQDLSPELLEKLKSAVPGDDGKVTISGLTPDENLTLQKSQVMSKIDQAEAEALDQVPEVERPYIRQCFAEVRANTQQRIGGLRTRLRKSRLRGRFNPPRLLRIERRAPRSTRRRRVARSASARGDPGRSTGGGESDDGPPRLTENPIASTVRLASAAAGYADISSWKRLSDRREGAISCVFERPTLVRIERIRKDWKAKDPTCRQAYRASKLAGLSPQPRKLLGSGLLQAQSGAALGISISLLMPWPRLEIKGQADESGG